MHDDELRRARALADPTRARLWRELQREPAARTVTELAAMANVGEATVRKHLDQLVDLGFVAREPAPATGAGRPRLVYRAAAAAPGEGATADAPYAKLASWLLSIRAHQETAEAAGRRIGLAAASAALAFPTANGELDGAAILQDVMAADGFVPTLTSDADGTVLTCHRCPYVSAVLDDRATVCGLHRGYAEGLLAGVGGAQLVGFEIRDPVAAGCRLVLAPGAPPRPSRGGRQG